MMSSTQRTIDRTRSLRILLAIVCVVLVVFIGSAQLLHMHAGSDRADDNCSLCAVAHLSALVTPALAHVAVQESVQPFHAAEAVAAPPRFVAYSHESRPPPVVTA